jgi:hypothetical protein
MCCFLALGAFVPRIAIALIALLTNWFDGVFANWIIPVLGFLLLPFTTLMYLAMWRWNNGELGVVPWLLVAAAFVIDLLNLVGGWQKRQDIPVVGGAKS